MAEQGKGLSGLSKGWAESLRARLKSLLNGAPEAPLREQMYVRLAVQLELERPAGQRAKVIVLTSPSSAAVIRDTALELSYTVAEELGRRVLLVDAEFGARSARGAPATPGLSDLLVGGVSGLAAAAQATNHPRVHTLSAGTPETTAAALAAGRQAEVIEAMCAAYESVIVMASPVLLESRWLMLATLADHTLLLAVEGSTHVSDLDASLRVLAECKAVGVGVLLTREPAPEPAHGPDRLVESPGELPAVVSGTSLHSRTAP